MRLAAIGIAAVETTGHRRGRWCGCGLFGLRLRLRRLLLCLDWMRPVPGGIVAREHLAAPLALAPFTRLAGLLARLVVGSAIGMRLRIRTAPTMRRPRIPFAGVATRLARPVRRHVIAVFGVCHSIPFGAAPAHKAGLQALLTFTLAKV
jgi:hypothetical protein